MLKYIFDRKLNLFDCLAISAIGSLGASNLWWFLLLIPAIIFSTMMERRCVKPNA